jgi:hypothetical protein
MTACGDSATRSALSAPTRAAYAAAAVLAAPRSSIFVTTTNIAARLQTAAARARRLVFAPPRCVGRPRPRPARRAGCEEGAWVGGIIGVRSVAWDAPASEGGIARREKPEARARG